MKFYSKTSIFLIFSLSFFVSNLISPTFVLAQSDWGSQGLNCVANGDVATIQGFECLFANILQVIVSIAGIAFLIMLINGGFQYLFSNNDPKKLATVSSTLTMAVIGLVGVIASFFILKFIYNFTGVNVMDFVIPDSK